MKLPQLKRIRWAVRACLMLGVAASVAANILHALDNPISQAIAAWPPLALLLTVELMARVPVTSRSLAVARVAAAGTIAGIAAWVSYWHMVGVALRYGERSDAAHMSPLSVDGLIIVASICLLELGRRITDLERPVVPVAVSPHPLAIGPRFDYDQPIGPSPAPAPSRGDKLSLKKPGARKPHPSAAERVQAAHKRTPKASDEQLAVRLNLSAKTVERYRPKPVSPANADTAEEELQPVP